ncbi:MBL fold metallo-hydrolase [Streptomyces asiaticus]
MPEAPPENVGSDGIPQPENHLGGFAHANRRRVLSLLAGASATAALSTSGAPTAAAATPREEGRTRVVLLGTAGGPSMFDPGRAGVSTAVVHEDRVYVVDLGVGSYRRLGQAGLDPAGPGNLLANVRGIFFTHLHSDHMVDWPSLYATAAFNSIGRTQPPIRVFGPGRRSELPRVFPPGSPEPPIVNPDDPMPGISAMTSYLRQAFAADLNDRARDSATPDPSGVFEPRDIDLTGVWDVDAAGKPPRLSGPIPVWEDGEVRITATLVDHHPTAPAFAYRFDTPDGSVVVSGDTTVTPNLIDLAHGTDYLVHEVIDRRYVDRTVSQLPPEQANALREHLLASHTTIEQVGRDVAEAACARNLVLTHLVPADNEVGRWRLAQKGYSGRLIVGADLMSLAVRR